MAAYATATDLANRWRPLVGAETARATVLLGDAAVWLRTWFPDLDDRIAGGALDASVPAMVSCSMVKRAMLDSDGMSAMQSQQVAGPFTDMVQRAFSNPDGNLYLTAREQDLLRGFPNPSGAVSMMSPGL